MTKIKMCGMKRICDIDFANSLMPDYIGFVFAKKSKRYIDFDTAEKLKNRLKPGIDAVGVFVDEPVENIALLAKRKIIDAVQLHGSEDEGYIKRLRAEISCPIIKAFRIENELDIIKAQNSCADYVMADSGGGTGKKFNHSLLEGLSRDFFLAGGLDAENVCGIVMKTHPYAVDASSSLETDGIKDKDKMAAFVQAVRNGKGEYK